MSGVTIAIVLVVIGTLAAVVILLSLALKGDAKGGGGNTGNLRNIVSSQRASDQKNTLSGQRPNIFSVASESSVEKKFSSSQVTLPKKLKYAQWKMSPSIFHACEALIGIFLFATVGQKFTVIIQLGCLLLGPVIMRGLLDRAVDKRFNAFDRDYAPFLLSLVGLLKTGMNPLGGIEAAAKGLEPGSLMKLECELMLERLRFGVTEDASIGSFAEEVYHPEIELFVQALLLSKRVGGNLSDTLDRLARQVRKRQYFRKQAVAAVAMQRGSIWFIIFIMVSLMLYLYLIYPQSILGAINDETGWLAYQFGFIVIAIGMYWVRQVTKIKV
jgi:tight adherence protein B